MKTVTVSPKHRIVIPTAIRTKMGIKAGDRLAVLDCDGSLRLVPMRPMREMRGFLRELDATFERDERDRV